MRGYTKIRAANDDKRNYVLRVDIVNDVHFVNLVWRRRAVSGQLRLILIDIGKTLEPVIIDEIDVVEEENRQRRDKSSEPDDAED